MPLSIYERTSHAIGWITHSVADAAAKGAMTAACGVAMRLFSHTLGNAMIALGAGIFVTKLVVNLTDGCDSPIFQLRRTATKLRSTYPRMQIIALIFIITVGILSSTASITVAAILGMQGGLTVDTHQHLQQHSTVVPSVLQNNRSLL